MQFLGNIGSSRKVSLYADGDGDFRPKFKWSPALDCSKKPVQDINGDRLYDAGLYSLTSLFRRISYKVCNTIS